MSDDDLLDEAIAALKAEEADASEGEATLSRLLGAMDSQEASDDALLDEALVALRSTAEPVSGALEAETLARVQASLAPAPRRAWAPLRNLLAVAAVLGIVWVAPSAWAFSRGIVVRWMAEAGLISLDAVEPVPERGPEPSAPDRSNAPTDSSPTTSEGERPPAVASLRTPSEPAPSEPAPSEPAPSEPALSEPARLNPAPSPTQPASPRTADAPRDETRVQPPTPAAPAAVDAPSAEPARDAETLAFTDAHRLHFGGAGAAESLAAWDTFLRTHPHGRYEPEARYNRASALVRLGRLSAARSALQPFAEGSYAGYRQAEAIRLVQALDARMAAEAP